MPERRDNNGMPKPNADAKLSGVKSLPIEEERRPWGSYHTLEEGPGYKI